MLDINSSTACDVQRLLQCLKLYRTERDQEEITSWRMALQLLSG